MLTYDQIAAIVNDCEVAEMKQTAIYVALFVLAVTPIIVIGIRLLTKRGIAISALAGLMLIAMATKPPVVRPQITWDTGLYDNGSFFDTNTWKTVNFRWTKDGSISNLEPIYFAARHKDHPELEYEEIGWSTSGLGAWYYTFSGDANATNYNYYAFTIGELHTNGVWIGNILQKVSPGSCGPDKMIIMKSRLEVNGKQIAPFKEDK